MLVNPDPNIVHTRGCGPLMQYWFRRGFWENIVLSLFGVGIGAFMMFVFQRNRNEYTQLRDEAEDRRRIVASYSTGSLRTGGNGSNRKQSKSMASRHSYSGVKNLPSNSYGSDEEEVNDFEQSRPMLKENA